MKKTRILLLTLLLLVVVVGNTFIAQAAPTVPQIDVKAFIPSGMELTQTVYFTGKNKDFQDIAILMESSRSDDDLPRSLAKILTFDKGLKKWKVVYELPETFEILKLDKLDLLSDGKEQIILYKHAGTGHFLSYKILGYINDSLKILLDRSGIVYGSYEVRNNQFIEKSGEMGTVFTWSESSFLGVQLSAPIRKPIDVNEKVISYSIDSNGSVSLSQPTLTVKLGETFHIVKEYGPRTERFMGSGSNSGNIDLKDGTQWIANRVGRVTLTIVPNYYDWDHAVDLEINIIK